MASQLSKTSSVSSSSSSSFSRAASGLKFETGSKNTDNQVDGVIQRKIIHIDMDAFFASVEQRDFPEHRGKPVIVGGQPQSRGVVAACSYEAREFGIHSAMPCSQAYQRCPDAVFLSPRFEVYREVSKLIQAIFREYTALVEPLSLDEAFLDVTGTSLCEGSATLIAKDIKCAIKRRTGLTASAGVSYNKFLAKIASDMDKPNGLFVILPSQAVTVLESLAIRRFHGVGKATEQKMKAAGIHNGGDLRRWSKKKLDRYFGRSGVYYYNIVRGIDDRPVQNNRVRKSIGAETTFAVDLVRPEDMIKVIQRLTEKVVLALKSKHMLAQTLTLKVKFDNFQQVTRSCTESGGFQTLNDMMLRLSQLLEKTDANRRRVRLLGVSVSNLSDSSSHQVAPKQIPLI